MKKVVIVIIILLIIATAAVLLHDNKPGDSPTMPTITEDSAPTDPEPTTPEPTDPKPTVPEPTDPEHIEPNPTDSEPTAPEPTTEPTTAPTNEPTIDVPVTEPPTTEPPATDPPVADPPETEEKTCSPWCHFGDFTTILEPTTISTGLKVAYCKNCGQEFIDEIPRLISPEKLENIDPRITITKNVADCTVAYDYKNLGVWDLRSWGGAPIMVITEDDCLEITYFKQDGSKVVYLLKPVEDAKVWISIWEDGSYRYHIFDGFENVDGTGN